MNALRMSVKKLALMLMVLTLFIGVGVALKVTSNKIANESMVIAETNYTFLDYTWLNALSADGITKENIMSINFIKSQNIPANYSGKITITNGIYASYQQVDSLYNVIIWSSGNIYAGKDSSDLFLGLSKLETISFNNFNTSNASNLDGFFYSCKMLKSINFGLEFNTSNVTDISQMFGGCSALTELDLSMFNTEKVDTVKYVFNGCSNLTTLNLSSFNLANLDSGVQFSIDIPALKILYTPYNTDSSKNITLSLSSKNKYYLDGDNSYTEIKVYALPTYTQTIRAGIDIEYYYVIGSNTELEDSVTLSFPKKYLYGQNLILPSLTTVNLTQPMSAEYVFDGWYTNENYEISNKVTVLTNKDFYAPDNKLRLFALFHKKTNINGTLPESWFFIFASKVKDISGVEISKYDIEKISFEQAPSNYSSFDGNVEVESGIFVSYKLLQSNYYELMVWSDSKIYAPENCRALFWFDNDYDSATKSNLTTITFNNFDTTNTKYMSYMFRDLVSLKKLDLSTFNTQNLIDDETLLGAMNDMFEGCSSLEELNLSSFNTKNARNMAYLFAFCSSLKTVKFSNDISFSNVSGLLCMFQDCSSLTSINLSVFDLANITINGVYGVLLNCNGLTEIIAPLNIPEGVEIELPNTFYTLDGTEYSTLNSETSGKTLYLQVEKKYELPYNWFDELNVNLTSKLEKKKIATIVFAKTKPTAGTETQISSGIKASYIPNANDGSLYDLIIWSEGEIFAPSLSSGLFSGFSSLTSIEFKNFNTSNAEKMNAMFNDCSSLLKLDLTNFNTDKVSNMAGMFTNCALLNELNISSFNTENVENMSSMFNKCSSLKNITFSSFFNTEKVTSMYEMFRSCSKLETLNLSNFTTPCVTRLDFMFYECKSLTSVDLSNFNTERVTSTYSMFYGCELLNELNLSSFDMKLVTSYNYMFSKCLNLKQITMPKIADSMSLYMLSSYTYFTEFGELVAGGLTQKFSQQTIKAGYVIMFKDENGKDISFDSNLYVPKLHLYKSEPKNLTTLTLTKEGYEFKGWCLNLNNAEGTLITKLDDSYFETHDNSTAWSIILYPTWEQKTYTITWTDWNGDVLEIDHNVPYGTKPQYDGATPTRPKNQQYSYEFAGWNKDIQNVTTDATYEATYTQTINKYVIKFVNYNGDELQVLPFAYGEMPTYNGEIPEHQGDGQYVYKFNGWSPAIEIVTGEATYTATFIKDENLYKVIWQDWNGVILETDENVAYGTMPSFDSVEPVRANNAQYTYKFNGWTPEIGIVVDNVVYTAKYEQTVRTYTVIWLNWNGDELEKDENVPYGTKPQYDGETPTKENLEGYSYTFKGWDKNVENVTGDITYTATFEEIQTKYSVTYVNYDGTVLQLFDSYTYGEMPTYMGEIPQRTADVQYIYEFKGWDKDIVAVTENATYTATYKTTLRTYLIIWKNENGTILEMADVAYGEMPTYSGETPIKERSKEFTYTFAGWDKDVAQVVGEETYTATYTQTLRKYTVVWYNEMGEELYIEQNVLFGTTLSYSGVEPTKDADVEYTYTFNGWEEVVDENAGIITCVPQFTKNIRYYTITINYIIKDEIVNTTTTEVAYSETKNVDLKYKNYRVEMVKINNNEVEFENALLLNHISKDSVVNIYYGEKTNTLLVVLIIIGGIVAIVGTLLIITMVRINKKRKLNRQMSNYDFENLNQQNKKQTLNAGENKVTEGDVATLNNTFTNNKCSETRSFENTVNTTIEEKQLKVNTPPKPPIKRPPVKPN